MTLVPPSRFISNKLPALVDFLANPMAGRRIQAAAAPPAAPRSAVAALISILALSFRFMSDSLTCFKPAVYRHLLPPPPSCLFALRSLLRLVLCSCRFFFCCSFLGGVCASSAHLSTSFLFSFFSCLDSYSVLKWTKPKLSGFIWLFSLKTLQRPQTATWCPFWSSCPVLSSSTLPIWCGRNPFGEQLYAALEDSDLSSLEETWKRMHL